MESIADVIAFCKDQAAFHEQKAAWPKSKPHAAEAHRKLAKQFSSSAEILENIALETLPDSSPEQQDLFQIDPFDLDGLPEELVSELAISKADQEDAQIIQLFRIARRPLNINEVMVGLFRKFDVQSKRTALSARLYRMATRDELRSVEKGVYALPMSLNLDFDKKTDLSKNESPQ